MFAKGNLAWAGRAAGFAVLVAALGGCAPLAITAAGIGGSTAVSHMLGGITYRTFTVPMPQVKSATMTALGRMQIKVNGSGKVSSGEVIKAHAGDRDIEIELE